MFTEGKHKLINIRITTVEAHYSTSGDDHDVSVPQLAKTHQQPSNYSQKIYHQHALHPEIQKERER